MALSDGDQALVDMLTAALENHDHECIIMIAETIRKRGAYEKDLAVLADTPTRTIPVPSRTLPIAVLLLALSFTPWQARAEGPVSVSVTQSVQTLAADTDVALTGTGAGLRMLCIQNIGTGLVNLAFGVAATSGTGWALNAAAGAGQAGGERCWDSTIPSQAVHARSLAGSTVVTLVGK